MKCSAYACLVAALASGLAACGGTTTGPSEGSGSCALIVHYDGQTYAGQVVKRAPTEGRTLGTAIIPACDDGSGDATDEEITVAEIEGVPAEVAVAWRGEPQMMLVREDLLVALPPELERLKHGPRCETPDEPIRLTGPFLGILGADGHTELDMETPYDVDLFVEESSSAAYERTFLTVSVPESLVRPLTRDEARAALHGGTISLTATCRDSRFVAREITAHS